MNPMRVTLLGVLASLLALGQDRPGYHNGCMMGPGKNTHRFFTSRSYHEMRPTKANTEVRCTRQQIRAEERREAKMATAQRRLDARNARRKVNNLVPIFSLATAQRRRGS